ncbi:hypothetical protein Trisim1_009365 [Trichoderma cf. simile WF8]
MPSPILTATLQAAALSTASNLCAQFIETYWNKQTALHLDHIQLFRFIVLSLITAPPNYLWQQFLEKSFPAYPSTQKARDVGKDIELKAMEEAAAGASIGEGSQSQSESSTQPRFSIRNTLTKWFIDCITAGAIMNTVAFLVIMGVLKGQPMVQISSNIKAETIPIIIAGYKIWPIASIVSFSFVPVHRRIVFLSFIGLLWGIYLSLVAARV